MFLNRLWADWQMYLHFYLSDSVMVTFESQSYSIETHCDQGTGTHFSSLLTSEFKFIRDAVCRRREMC